VSVAVHRDGERFVVAVSTNLTLGHPFSIFGYHALLRFSGHNAFAAPNVPMLAPVGSGIRLQKCVDAPHSTTRRQMSWSISIFRRSCPGFAADTTLRLPQISGHSR
jgi:hypothetical protein